MIKSLSPNMIVENVNETIEYYKKFIGFELIHTVPDEGTFNWAMMKHGEINLMFQSVESIIAELPQFSGQLNSRGCALFMVVEGLEQMYRKIKDDVEVIKPFEKTFYGMNEFTILDINGYFLTFAEPVAEER
ncbi:MAG: hypothetical protein K9J16_00620 [Melioribacteraceae bacterium]|nr:hypothetical protein [Melioribacteraceae bacterium]MCF8354095.1 hypothetical protein [Melioribacteraceae bacterium]MCF8393767.1 hypothetical protein [Melioribacteraceae bacterium]MCF8419511.1 hypothetical protein [Melioribacteraceae bacterium]